MYLGLSRFYLYQGIKKESWKNYKYRHVCWIYYNLCLQKTSSSHIADLKFLPYPDINYSCLSLIYREFLPQPDINDWKSTILVYPLYLVNSCCNLISSLRMNYSCLSFLSREFLLQPDIKSENRLFLSILYTKRILVLIWH